MNRSTTLLMSIFALTCSLHATLSANESDAQTAKADKSTQIDCLLYALDSLRTEQDVEQVLNAYLICTTGARKRDSLVRLALLSYYTAWPGSAGDKGIDAAYDRMFWMCCEHLAELEDVDEARSGLLSIIDATLQDAGGSLGMRLITQKRFPDLKPVREH